MLLQNTPKARTMKQLLMVWHSQHGHNAALADAAEAGIQELADEVALRRRRAFDTTLEDLLWADALLLVTPENFGYMSGAMKDFMDRTYDDAQGKTIGLPYAIIIGCGNDGRGAVSAIERIATGYGWKLVADPVISRGSCTTSAAEQARTLGQTLAAGLSMGLF